MQDQTGMLYTALEAAYSQAKLEMAHGDIDNATAHMQSRNLSSAVSYLGIPHAAQSACFCPWSCALRRAVQGWTAVWTLTGWLHGARSSVQPDFEGALK